LPLEEINIFVEPFVSKANDWLSLVPNKAVVPKLFPPCTNAFVAEGTTYELDNA
jgi:hypothetical protein